MPAMERNVVKPPNESTFKSRDGDKRNSYMGLTPGASTAKPSNERFKDGDPGFSGFSAREGSPVKPPNERLKDGDPGYSAPFMPATVEPGRGAVPVNPFMAGGVAVKSMPVSDMAKAK